MCLFCTRRAVPKLARGAEPRQLAKCARREINSEQVQLGCISISLTSHRHTAHRAGACTYLCLRCVVKSHRLSFIQFGSYKSQVIIYMRIEVLRSSRHFIYYFVFCCTLPGTRSLLHSAQILASSLFHVGARLLSLHPTLKIEIEI